MSYWKEGVQQYSQPRCMAPFLPPCALAPHLPSSEARAHHRRNHQLQHAHEQLPPGRCTSSQIRVYQGVRVSMINLNQGARNGRVRWGH